MAQIAALLGLGALRTNLNLVNRGQWSQASEGKIVETNAILDLGRIAAMLKEMLLAVAPWLPGWRLG